MPDLIATYPMALLALGILAFSLTLQSFIAGFYKNGVKKQMSGYPVEGTHDDLVYRIVRTHMNGVENFSAFFALAILAMIAGVGVTLLTWLIVVTVALRMLYWLLYYARIGTDSGGIRSITHVVALVVNLVIGVLVLLALI
ncbi:MAG: MAPEG family protein [Paracoccaceae bacterium]